MRLEEKGVFGKMKRWKAKAAAYFFALLASVGMTELPAEAQRYRADDASTTRVTTDEERAVHEPQGTQHVGRRSERGSAEPYSVRLNFGTGIPGALRFNDAQRAMREWDVEVEDTGGTLLFSDSPEYVTEDGILYEDTVTGDARILYYHLNHTNTRKKVAVVLQNEGDSSVVVKVTRGGASRPSSDYLEVGKSTQLAYFQTKRDDLLYVQRGTKRILEPEMNHTVLEPGQLVYGVYDFHADGPVKVSVILYPATADPLKFIAHAHVLPKDEQRLRGTFQGMDRVIKGKLYNPDKDGVVYIPIGDNRQDVFRTGIDATDGSLVTNVGNYGVLYRIRIPTTGREATQYYLTPLGGVYAGAMSVDFGHGSSLLETPGGRLFFGDAIPPDSDADRAARLVGKDRLKVAAELSDLGSYHSSVQPSFELSPPGASNLPVQIILMPAGK